MCWLDGELRDIEKKQINNSENDEAMEDSIGVGVRREGRREVKVKVRSN